MRNATNGAEAPRLDPIGFLRKSCDIRNIGTIKDQGRIILPLTASPTLLI